MVILLSVDSLWSHQLGKVSTFLPEENWWTDFLCWTQKISTRLVPLLTVPQCHSWLAEKDLALSDVQGNFIPIPTEVYTVYHLVGPDLLHEIYRNLWLSIACPWKWNANNAIKNNIESVCDNVHNDYAILDTHNFSCYCTERARIDFCGLM